MKQFNYLPHNDEDISEMLKTIGVSSQEELFFHIPESLRKAKLQIPESHSELEIQQKLLELAHNNKWHGNYISFIGSGCYDRFIPSAIETIVSRSEFLTAYTPYQPEISQGTLQMIYEFQSMICNLTGMEVANASMYDGATAAAEAALMACRITKKQKIIISRSIHPETQFIIKTYMTGPEIEDTTIPINDGVTNHAVLERSIDNTVACVIIQVPNTLGNIEDVEKIEKITHAVGALLVVIVEPISIGILQSPGNYGADIVVGDGQSLGSPMMFGGPSFGFLSTKEKYLRQVPGRIVGATLDSRGDKVYTLTLQTREQHIRRDKATSNICTNNSLNALAASVYLSLIGPQGLKEIANICFQRAHYLANKISQIPGFIIPFQNFFNEFVLILPEELPVDFFIDTMLKNNILAGIKISHYYTEIPNSILLTVTEKNSPADLFCFSEIIKEI